jgi:hypothetical protein
MNGRVELPIALRRSVYRAATKAASSLGPNQARITMHVKIRQEPIGMPRQLGFERGQQTVSLKLELSLEEGLTQPVA